MGNLTRRVGNCSRIFENLSAICALLFFLNGCNAFENRRGICGAGAFQCDNGGCVSQLFVCDSFDYCGDNSDERFCSQYGNHSLDAFALCKSDRRIPREFVCDGIDDCLDGYRSDELNCERTSLPGATTLRSTAAAPRRRPPPELVIGGKGPIYPGSVVTRGPNWNPKWDERSPEGITGFVIVGSYVHSYDSSTLIMWLTEVEDGSIGNIHYIIMGSPGRICVSPVLYKADDLEVGNEVVRGPGWNGTDLDGGEGKSGLVTEKSDTGMVRVRWGSTGQEAWYMGSTQGKYDLLLVRRSIPAEETVRTRRSILKKRRPNANYCDDNYCKRLWRRLPQCCLAQAAFT